MTNTVIMAEFYSLLRDRFGYGPAIHAYNNFRTNAAFVIQSWPLDRDAETYSAINRLAGIPLSYADASLVVLARNLEVRTAFAFDNDLRQAGLELVPGEPEPNRS